MRNALLVTLLLAAAPAAAGTLTVGSAAVPAGSEFRLPVVWSGEDSLGGVWARFVHGAGRAVVHGLDAGDAPPAVLRSYPPTVWPDSSGQSDWAWVGAPGAVAGDTVAWLAFHGRAVGGTRDTVRLEILAAVAPGGEDLEIATAAGEVVFQSTVDVPLTPRVHVLALRVQPVPARHHARIELDLPARATARVDIFDVSGRRVATLHEGAAGPGTQHWWWRAGGAPGTYFVRARVGNRQLRERLILLP